MAQTIQIRRGTGSAVPSSLADGELAINLDSGRLYYGSGSTVLNNFTFKDLTAENYVVSSSVTHYTFQALSGSTDFGDDSADIHKRTGSLNVSGALSMDGDIELSNNGKIFVGSSGTEIMTNNDDYWKINANGLEAARFSSTGVTINEGGAASADFRVESDHDPYLLFVDAGANKMAIGTHIVSDSLLTVDGDVNANSFTASGNISASGDIYTTRVFVDNVQSLGISGDDATLFGGHGSNKILLGKGNQTPSVFTNGSITASGNISSSGDIYSNRYFANEQPALNNVNGAITLGYDNTYPINIGKSTNPIGIYGHITASGHISASGVITAEGLVISDDVQISDDLTVNGDIIAQGASSIIQAIDTTLNYVVELKGEGGPKINWGDTDVSTDAFMTMGAYNNINQIDTAARDFHLYGTNTTAGFYFDESTGTFGVGTITPSEKLTIEGNISASGNLILGGNVTIIKSGSDGNAVLTLEADSGNDDENANPYIHLKQDGGAIAGMIGLSGDADKWPDGTTLTGATGNAMVIGMTGAPTSTNRQLFLVAGNSASLRVENDADIHIYENLNVTKTISVADTSVVDYDITNANTLTFGRANRPTIFLGTSFTVQTPITASGEISASGTIYAPQIDFNPASSYDYINRSDAFGVTIKTSDNKITLLANVTASGNISSTTGIIKAGWHNSPTRIKILVSDFIPDDIGRPAMIDDSGSDRWLESHGTAKLFASLPIPTGFKATHVHIYGSGTSALEVSEMDINSKSVTSKGTGNIGTELNITDVTSTATNYLLLELAQASGEEVYGGYVTIEVV